MRRGIGRPVVDGSGIAENAGTVAHPNEEIVRDLYAAMERGDGRALAQALRPDTRWIIAGHGELAGTCVGGDAIFGFWRRVARETGGGLRLSLRDVLANDTRAVALVDVVGVRGEATLRAPQVVVFELEEDRICEARFICEDQAAYDAFWS
jgi:ketosteroid isomerase-like protein